MTARGFRLLLHAYPPGPRRAELLGTLTEIAEETGQRRPTARQVADLLRCGMRARLGFPKSTAVVVLAALFTLIGGLFGAAVAAPAGWALTPALPQGAAAEELKSEVLPGLTVWGGGDAPHWVPTGDGESEQYGYSVYWAAHTDQTRDPLRFATEVRDRLAATGWTIENDVTTAHQAPDELPPNWDSASFRAARDGLTLRFDDTVVVKVAPWDSEGSVRFEVSRRAPAVLWVTVVAGGLAGALLTWLFAGWVARRVEGRDGLPVVVATVSGIALLILLPTAAFTWLWSMNGDDVLSGSELWFIGLRLYLLGSRIPVILTVLVFAVLAVLQRPRRVATAGITTVAVLSLTSLAYAGSLPALTRDTAPTAGVCTPAVPAADDPDSSRAFVFINRQTTAEQRNLIEAAISRNPGVYSMSFVYEDPASQSYRDAFCAGRPLPAGTGTGLPFFWEVDLNNPGGLLPGLAAEVDGMPGVIAVRSA